MTDSAETVDTPQASEPASTAFEYSNSYASQSDRPELLVAGAFAGGLVLAVILKRLAS